MNTERRHELETNSLAQGLNTWSDKLRPYTSAALAIVAALLGLYIVTSLWNSYQATRDRAAWDDFELALFEGDVEARNLQRLADSENHQGTEMQEWAYMSWADRQLLRASQLYLSDRKGTKERLDSIKGIYDQFADGASSPELKNRARLGLARIAEMEGDLDEAKAQYGLVDGAFEVIAEARVKDLDAKPTKETIDWLAKVELPKRAPPTGPGTPGARPGFEATPPAADAGSALNFDSTQSLEQILGSIKSDEDEKRYEGEPKPTEPATTETAPATEPTAPANEAAPVEGAAPAEAGAAGEEAAPAEATPPAPATEESSDEVSDEKPAQQ